MIITMDNATEYLLKRRLIDLNCIIDGNLKIYDSSRKNRNLRIMREKSKSYLLKQPSVGDYSAERSIKIEGKLYSLIKENEALESIQETIPNLIDLDDHQNILITEYINNAVSFHEFSYNLPMGEFPLQPMHILGKKMAIYHRDFEKIINIKREEYSNAISFLPKSLPFNITVVRPNPHLLSTISPADMNLLKIIQQYPQILDFFETLYQEWNTQKTLIHGDIKWDNMLAISEKESEDIIDIKIIDWEFAAIGDPAWDVGGVLHDFIVFWIYSLPLSEIQKTEEMIELTQYPLDNLKRAIRSFWKTYIDTYQMPYNKIENFLLRSSKYCAIRLIQKVYEMHQMSYELTNGGIYTIQTALNIILDIDEAILHLFGIPVYQYRSII